MLREILIHLHISKKAVIKISLGGFHSVNSGDGKQVFQQARDRSEKL